MNVRCPVCNTLFRVPDQKAGSPGVRFRCGRCKHVFLAGGPEGAVATPTPAPASPTPAPPHEREARPAEPPRHPAWPEATSTLGGSGAWGEAPRRAAPPAAGPLDIDFDGPSPPPAAPPAASSAAAAPTPQAGADIPGFVPRGGGFVDDRTVVEQRPTWLGGLEESLDSVREAQSGGRWAPAASPIDPYEEARSAPPPAAPPAPAPSPPPPSGALRAEELFGGEPTPAPSQRPVAPMPRAQVVLPSRETLPPQAAAGAPKVVPWEQPRAPQREVRGWHAVLRSALLIAGLVLLFLFFVLWKNDWRLSPFGQSVARAFAPRSADLRSHVPSLELKNVRRVLYGNRMGERMLVVSGQIHNGGANGFSAVSVLVRFVDKSGVPLAEREHIAVGLFEPPVLAGFRSAADVDQEYKKRRGQAALAPGDKRDFMIVFFPIPPELDGKRSRMLVEITTASGA